MIYETESCVINIVLEKGFLTGNIPDEYDADYDLTLILGEGNVSEIIRIMSHEAEHVVIKKLENLDVSLKYDEVFK